MQSYTLVAQPRTLIGRKNRALRVEGNVPVVAYGPALAYPKNLSVERSSFVRVHKAAGESSVLELQIEGETSLHVLIQDIQVDPIRGEVIHVDFRAIDMNKPVEAKVKLVFVGESQALKSGGTLVQALNALTVRCLPANLPHELVVDMTKLATFEDVVKVKDIVIGTGVEVLESMDATVALVEAPRTEEEIAALNGAVDLDVTKVEKVEKKKTAEDAEGEAAATEAPKAEKKEAKK